MWTSRAGWAFIATAALYVAYLVIALTVGAGYEDGLVAAAERENASVNTMSAAAMARVVRDHAVYSTLTTLFLFLPGLALLRGVSDVRATAGGRAAGVARWSALAGLIVLSAFLVLNLGLLLDPLPPVVRDLDVLTMPMVTTAGLLALVAMGSVAEAARHTGVARRAGRVSSILCALLGVLGVIGLFTTDQPDPVPPLFIVPAGLILGVALVRHREAPARTSRMPAED
jgi:hypothetical protein